MKRLSILLCLLLVAACTNNETPNDIPTANPVLTITSETNIWFEGKGGTGEITYTIENLRKGVSLTASTTADWITDITIGDSVTYTVAENTSNEERRGTIELCYGTATKQVVVKQRTLLSEDIKALTTSGSYYYGGDGLYNYYLVLSIDGMNSNGNLQSVRYMLG